MDGVYVLVFFMTAFLGVYIFHWIGSLLLFV